MPFISPDSNSCTNDVVLPDDEMAVDSEDIDHPGSNVIPIHVLGITDTDLTRVSTSELMSYVLVNLFDTSQGGGYAIRHSMSTINDFGKNVTLTGALNPLAAAFPILFPYGIGSVEAEWPIKVSLRGHSHWALQFYDWWFVTHHSFLFMAFALIQKHKVMWAAQLQMSRKDFKRDTLVLSSITLNDLKQAEAEERRKETISNAQV